VDLFYSLTDSFDLGLTLGYKMAFYGSAYEGSIPMALTAVYRLGDTGTSSSDEELLAE